MVTAKTILLRPPAFIFLLRNGRLTTCPKAGEGPIPSPRSRSQGWATTPWIRPSSSFSTSFSAPRLLPVSVATSAHDGATECPATPCFSRLPPDFESTYALIQELRADKTAVVDRVGASALHGHQDAPRAPEEAAFQTLVSLMLSSQTKDVINAKVMARLREHGLSVSRLLDETDESTLNGLIRGVGFHNTKTRHIIATCRILRQKYGGCVPATMDELLELPGVGPKMAIIYMHVVHKQVVGISVDTHVHRIANQLGWTSYSPDDDMEDGTDGSGGGDSRGTARPEQTRRELERRVPFELWGEVNELLVGLGQETQTEMPKLLRKCSECSRPVDAFSLIERLVGPEKLGRALKKAGIEDPR